MKILAFVLFAVFMCVSTAHAQKWVKLAEFPEPTEELLGARRAASSTCSAASLRAGSRWGWSTNTIPRPTSGRRRSRCRSPLTTSLSRSIAARSTRSAASCCRKSGPPAWVPIDNAWEYDPASDSWQALAPMPTRRGSPVAVTAGDRIYVIGGATPAQDTAVPRPGPHGRRGRWKNTIPPRIPGVSAARCPRRATTRPQASGTARCT